MPTIACKNSVFLHIPKCAGSALSAALHTSRIGVYNYSDEEMPHAWIATLKPEHKAMPRWTVVRHCSDWLRSFYAYRWQHGWDAKPRLCRQPYEELLAFRTKNFDEYIDYVCSLDRPISRIFERFVDDKTVVLRIETFNADLPKLLKLEPEFNPNKLGRVNKTQNHVELTKEHRDRIWELEKECFSQWYDN